MVQAFLQNGNATLRRSFARSSTIRYYRFIRLNIGYGHRGTSENSGKWQTAFERFMNRNRDDCVCMVATA
jgi:hypothetical protein